MLNFIKLYRIRLMLLFCVDNEILLLFLFLYQYLDNTMNESSAVTAA